jgi:cell division protein FtsB
MSPRRTPGGQGPGRDRARPGKAVRRSDVARAPRPTTEPAGRAVSRPAAVGAARPGAAGSARRAAKRTRAPQPRRLTGRATVLGLILVALALATAYPVRVYLAQEDEIQRLEAAQQAQRDRIRGLTEELSKWDDDEYVIAQARRRLNYVRPGEVAYVIVEEPPATPPPTDTGRAADTGPWYGQMWSTIQAADDPVQR